MLKKNDIVKITITDISDKGDGLGKYEGFPLFVRHALPGDIINAKVVKMKKNYGYAVLENLLKPSPDRVKSPCPASRICGGCQLAELSYGAQLRIKLDRVNSALERIGGLAVGDGGFCSTKARGPRFSGTESSVPVKEIVPSDEILRYRNKAQIPVGYDKNGNLVSGFYSRHSHEIVPCADCVLMPEKFNEIRDAVISWMKANRISAYDESTRRGVVRHILIREGRGTGEICVCLVINADALQKKKELTEALRGIEGLVSVCFSVNKDPGNAVMGKDVVCVYGKPYIEDMIGDKRFRVSPRSFYQVNPGQTIKLYDYVKHCIGDGGFCSTKARSPRFSGTESSVPDIIDLFCGIGTISIYAAEKDTRICGIEVIEDAVNDARINAEMNGLENFRFFAVKLGDGGFAVGTEDSVPLKRDPCALVEQNPPSPNAHVPLPVVIVDPPRKGCDIKTLEAIESLSPGKLIYVSCDPATLARDLKILTGKGFGIVSAKAFDMFPMTTHVETVILLSPSA